MAGADRKRQQKLEKTRKKRELAKKEARKLEAKFQGMSLLRMAASAPFGPCWVSTALDEPVDEGGLPALISVVVTRRIRGQLLGEMALVDRTCLGVKNANLLPLQPELSLREFVAEALQPLGELRECEAAEAQAVVFHAIDYAASLGFGYHPDFEATLFEPRPESLRETPLAHPTRPFYAAGPNDDAPMILHQLQSVVGENFGVDGLVADSWFEGDDDNDDEDEDDHDSDVIETTAEEG
jgi:hypothetical protein